MSTSIQNNNNYRVIGQATLEYTALLGVIALALCAFAMRSYLKNVIMGRMHQDMARTFGREQLFTTTTSDLNMTVRENVTVAGNSVPLTF